MQADVLDRRPDNREVTTLRGEHINLIGALPDIAEETLNGIRRLNMPMHALRELVKGQQVLFILSQAPHGFWITLAVLGFEGSQLGQCLLICRLLPDAHQFGLDIATLSSGDRIEDIALLMDQTALTGRGRKQLRDRCQHSIMTVGQDEVDLGRSSCSQVLEHTDPSLLAFLRTGSERQDLFVSCQIHS
jgi:hypothetical protein